MNLKKHNNRDKKNTFIYRIMEQLDNTQKDCLIQTIVDSVKNGVVFIKYIYKINSNNKLMKQ